MNENAERIRVEEETISFFRDRIARAAGEHPSTWEYRRIRDYRILLACAERRLTKLREDADR